MPQPSAGQAPRSDALGGAVGCCACRIGCLGGPTPPIMREGGMAGIGIGCPLIGCPFTGMVWPWIGIIMPGVICGIDDEDDDDIRERRSAASEGAVHGAGRLRTCSSSSVPPPDSVEPYGCTGTYVGMYICTGRINTVR